MSEMLLTVAVFILAGTNIVTAAVCMGVEQRVRELEEKA